MTDQKLLILNKRLGLESGKLKNHTGVQGYE